MLAKFRSMRAAASLTDGSLAGGWFSAIHVAHRITWFGWSAPDSPSAATTAHAKQIAP